MPLDESSPLLQFPGLAGSQVSTYGDLHDQFCNLSGVPPMNIPASERSKPHPESLYHRAVSHRRHQNAIYLFTATLTNTLLLSQVVLGATLTGLGASDSSRILITVFGALNTVIAGLIAFLKSRGQPMRARMFRDDLERVVDEIENSATMWLGISRNIHGYNAIDTDDQVTVRSEVARLTRLYDRAVKTNTMNDPDTYAAGMITDFHTAALKGSKPDQPALPAPVPAGVAAPAPAPVPVVDPDESPATKAATKAPETPKDTPTSPVVPPKDAANDVSTSPKLPAEDAAKEGATPPGPPSKDTAKDVVNQTPATDDESPASAAHPNGNAAVTASPSSDQATPKDSMEPQSKNE